MRPQPGGAVVATVTPARNLHSRQSPQLHTVRLANGQATPFHSATRVQWCAHAPLMYRWEDAPRADDRSGAAV